MLRRSCTYGHCVRLRNRNQRVFSVSASTAASRVIKSTMTAAADDQVFDLPATRKIQSSAASENVRPPMQAVCIGVVGGRDDVV